MFASWFRPKCPINTRDKVWIETRMAWLVEQFGIDTMREAEIILPTAEYFPREWDGTEEEARELFEQVAVWMSVALDSLGLEFVDDLTLPGALGHYDRTDETMAAYGRPMIRIAQSILQLPAQLAATMIHEMAHERLLGAGILTGYEDDHEHLTDLLPVFLGLGVVQANATIHEATLREGRSSWYTAFRSGYLTSFELGYALALFAWHRGDDPQPIARELRLDAKSTFQAGLRFLRKTGESLFEIGQTKTRPPPQSPREWLEVFQSPRADLRLDALWQWSDQAERTPETRQALLTCLRDNDPWIQGAAAYAYIQHAEMPPDDARQICALFHGNEDAARSAVQCFQFRPLCPDVVVPQLIALLQDDRDLVRSDAIRALTDYGPAARSAIPAIVTSFIRAIHDCINDDLLATALCTISENPQREFEEFAPEDIEHETWDAAILLIAETRKSLAEQQTESPDEAADEVDRV